ncbi:alpha-1:6-mannosyl-glycoprotein 2-beta-N-acetylglucosaminyltransferase-like protein [Dinothrombium tinctorium]|uniref:Alpha-1,6-mannosyl-glycoprotein 2-beta-N-acetylglucosaminyltransferase n=1 Tax=Dinothrombium tinctorium TaxID=1965070 RepID=A0A443R3V8_9ACAR|nr:alpha-1:6-mannosyl-glycoprotein 2-beta-N-acetylglucosaminyltransferase-like protein [Dinothrombium tinctorium]
MNNRNSQRKMLNFDKFGSLNSNDFIIVVQVHRRVKYLKLLIESLQQVIGIERTLLVFSHDFYEEEINRVIESILFARVVQIFFPFSIQLFPNTFPGNDPSDCPRNIEKFAAKEINCTNADHPDTYGHFREAKFAQMKHHWFWKINFVFDELLPDHNGYFLFLEEDLYCSPDLLHIMQLMITFKNTTCKTCDILTLGELHKTFLRNNVISRTTSISYW